MSAKRGSELLIKRGDGADPEVFTTVAAIRSGTLNLNGNKINVTTADDIDANDEIWNTYITGPKEFSFSGEAIAKAGNKTQVQSLYDDFATGTVTNYEVVVPYLGTFTVAMIVDNFSYNAPYDDVLSFSIGISASAAPTFVAEA